MAMSQESFEDIWDSLIVAVIGSASLTAQGYDPMIATLGFLMILAVWHIKRALRKNVTA